MHYTGVTNNSDLNQTDPYFLSYIKTGLEVSPGLHEARVQVP